MRFRQVIEEIAMKTGMLVFAPMVLFTSLVFADDSMNKVTPTDHQLLKQCMERQKSNTNVVVSKAEAKRYCKDELKRQKETGASPEPAPSDAPAAQPAPSAPPAPSDSPAPDMTPPG
jgi:hypothetical protein